MCYIKKHFILLILLLTGTIAANAQCITIAMPDTLHTCHSDSVTAHITVTVPPTLTPIDSFWSPTTGIDTTDFLNPIFILGNTNQYYWLTYFALLPGQLVQDGNFDQLNTANMYFTSAYTDTSGTNCLWPEAHYSINSDPHAVHNNFTTFGDHTSGTGNMLIVNGAGTPVDIWCETITVTPNTNYDFSAWAASCTSGSPAILQFKINGVLIGAPLSLTPTVGQWQEFHVLWNSGSNTSIQICINDQQTALSGNDFAIDDISFRQICQTTDSVYITVANFNDSLLVSELPCQDGKVTFSTKSNDGHDLSTTNFTWRFGDGQTAPGTNVVHTYAAANFYLVTLDMNIFGCMDSLVNVLSVNNFTPRIPSIQDTAICKNGAATLWVGAGNTYQWTPATGLSDPTAQRPVASPGETTTYIATINFGENCVTKDTVTLTVRPLPDVKVSPTTGVVDCANPRLQMQSSGAVYYTWSPANVMSDPLAKDPYASPDETTTITLSGVDSFGCANKDSMVITVPDVSLAFLPTAFTPNNDGKNDVLRPIAYCGFRIHEFHVYNRWGQQVFYSEGDDETIEKGWNGMFNGQPAPIDTYFYVVMGTTKEGLQKTLKATAELIR